MSLEILLAPPIAFVLYLVLVGVLSGFRQFAGDRVRVDHLDSVFGKDVPVNNFHSSPYKNIAVFTGFEFYICNKIIPVKQNIKPVFFGAFSKKIVFDCSAAAKQ